jgi:hypothetical protein
MEESDGCGVGGTALSLCVATCSFRRLVASLPLSQSSAMARVVAVCATLALAIGGAGSGSSGATQPPLHRGCPPGGSGATYPTTTYEAALVQAKRAAYAQRFSIQGQAYASNAQNTELVSAVRVQNLSLVPGMRKLFSVMHRRCGKHTPYIAWSFTFHRFFEIVPDYWPYFVVRSSDGWYVF